MSTKNNSNGEKLKVTVVWHIPSTEEISRRERRVKITIHNEESKIIERIIKDSIELDRILEQETKLPLNDLSKEHFGFNTFDFG